MDSTSTSRFRFARAGLEFLRNRGSHGLKNSEVKRSTESELDIAEENCDPTDGWDTDDEVANWKAIADWWMNKWSFCAGRGMQGQQTEHTMRTCEGGGKSQLRKGLGEAIYEEGFWALGGCRGCAMPRELCQAWSRTSSGAWKRDLAVKCQYGKRAYDTVIGFYYCSHRKYRQQVFEDMMDEGIHNICDEDVAAWLGRKIVVEVESCEIMRQLKAWTMMIQDNNRDESP